MFSTGSSFWSIHVGLGSDGSVRLGGILTWTEPLHTGRFYRTSIGSWFLKARFLLNPSVRLSISRTSFYKAQVQMTAGSCGSGSMIHRLQNLFDSSNWSFVPHPVCRLSNPLSPWQQPVHPVRQAGVGCPPPPPSVRNGARQQVPTRFWGHWQNFHLLCGVCLWPSRSDLLESSSWMSAGWTLTSRLFSNDWSCLIGGGGGGDYWFLFSCWPGGNQLLLKSVNISWTCC